MVKLLKRTKLMIIYSVIILSLLAYFGILGPMKQELTNSTIGNFVQLAGSKYQTIDNTINRSIEGAAGISSRSMIKSKIIEFLRQDITLTELKDYTQLKYEDGAEVLDHLIIAERIVENVSIAQYRNTEYTVPLQCELSISNKMQVTFDTWDDKTILKVNSPIVHGYEVIGCDCLVFDLSQQIHSLSTDDYKANIITADQYHKYQQKLNFLKTQSNVYLYDNDNSIYAFMDVQYGAVFVVHTQRNELFHTINVLARKSVIIWFGVFIALLLVIYLYIIKFAKNEILKIEVSRDEFKGLAYKDKMTNVYSRLFLEVWNNSVRTKFGYYSVVMIDIDNFKAVNDHYGHLVGDEVIKAVAKMLMTSVRHGDYVVRYGGDEFLILLENIKEKNAGRIMDRISSKITNIKSFDFTVSISYGISTAYPKDDFYEKLRVADDRMYTSKRNKK